MPAKLPRLLLVEDDPPFARTLRRLLAQSWEVVVCASYHDAEHVLAGEERFDAYVLDLHLGDGHAADLWEALDDERRRRVLVLTGGAFCDGDRDFLRAQLNPPLMKPFERERLHEALSNILHAAPRGGERAGDRSR